MSDERKAEILDLDKVIPPKRAFILAGKEIDVSRIPLRVTLKVADNMEKLTNESRESFDLMVELALDVCRPSFPEITKEWLLDNVEDVDRFMQLMEFIMRPIINRAVSTGKSKNAGAAR